MSIKPSRSLWPLGIIATFVLFIAGMVVMICYAVSANPDLVASDYYEREIEYQGLLDRLNRAKQLTVSPTVTYDAANRAIRISLPPKHAAAGVRGEVELYRPSAAGLDQRVALAVDAQGAQALDTSKLQHGLWKIRVQWTASGEDYAIEEIVVVGGKSS